MSYREGRWRLQRDYALRLDEQSHHGRGSNPPSRHLWVGNIADNTTENDLAHHFLRFGNLDSIAFQPGRSYAFINYRRDEDAFDALKELQGFPIGGNPLNIQFAKAEKSLMSPHNEYSSRRDEMHSMARENSFNMRDSRGRHSNPDASYVNKSKTSGKDSEPSEVLWIGFPEGLKVDEFDLRKAFTSFGEIEKITAFPGRTYAFVRFRNIRSSCRAKEALHGKLFGDPRVNIFFARNESGGSNRERNSTNAPVSLHARSYERSRSPERVRYDRNFDSMSSNFSNRSPPYVPNLDTRDGAVMGNVWPTGNDAPEHRRFPGHGPDSRPNIYNQPISQSREMGAHFDEFAPQKIHRQGQFDEDPWDLPEDVSFLHEPKKFRRDPYPPEDLPDHHLSEMGNVKHAHPSDTPQSGIFNKSFDSRTSECGLVHERLMNPRQPFGERSDNWNLSTDNFRAASTPLLQPNHTNEHSSKVIWKWEGMIAKVGNPVCRARCFPVGKPMEMALPEYIDCTSKTNLNMLAKQYYEASSAWVVFFVPADDPDIPFYNEFMNFLGEKQRAAVAVLDQQTSLFLVAPSEFSEKVLKVPGKLSISGVILRFGPTNRQLYDNNEAALTPSQSSRTFQNQISPSQPYLPAPVFTNYEKPNAYVAPNVGSGNSMSSVHKVDELRHDYFQKQPPGPIWSDHAFQNPSFSRNFTSGAHGSATASVNHTYSLIPERMQEAPHNNYTPSMPDVPVTGNGNRLVHLSMPDVPMTGNDNRLVYPPMPDAPVTGNDNRLVYPPMPDAPVTGNGNRLVYLPMPDVPVTGNGNRLVHPPMQDVPMTGNGNRLVHPSMRDVPVSGNGNQLVHSSMPVAGIEPGQLAQLASSLLGQRNQFSGMPSTGEYVPSGNINQSRYSNESQNSGLPANGQISSGTVQPVSGAVQPLPQISPQREVEVVGQVNQQVQNVQEGQGEDTQKRLQATLALAASLLQQIQQAKGK